MGAEVERWGLLQRSNNRLDGYHEHLTFENCLPVMFLTKREARQYAEQKYYYCWRKDMRAEPHGRLVPLPVRVRISSHDR